jgi:putative PIN family toxin of toxin-antitoxin system
MRVVLDTNVLVSALITPEGVCDQIVRHAMRDRIAPCADHRVLAEYDDVLLREELPVSRASAERLRRVIHLISVYVPAAPLDVDLPDPDDLCFLEVAAAARARLVTGNIRDFPPSQRAGVDVLTPRELLDLLKHGL